MRQNASLSRKQERAAVLLANGGMTADEVAVAVGVVRQTVVRWQARAAFAGRVGELVAEYRLAVMQHGIADRVERVRGYDQRRAMLLRALDPEKPDRHITRELRELEKQAAIEVGDWQEKHQVSIVPTVREYPAGWGSTLAELPAPAGNVHHNGNGRN